MNTINALGRRKSATARVYLSEGKGEIIVNKRAANDYFSTPVLLGKIQQPFNATETAGKYDVKVNVGGGGVNGQAEAIRLGIARALVMVDPNFKPALKAEGMMTRDPRMVERKKPGQKKARKKFQFSKR